MIKLQINHIRFWLEKVRHWHPSFGKLTRRKFTFLSVGVVLVIFVVVMLVSMHRSGIHDLPGIEKSGRLYVLTEGSSMGFTTKNGSIRGFQYEIIKAFADTLGVEMVITQENDFEKCKKLIVEGDYAILANFTPVTVKLKKELAFTRSLNVSRQILIQRFTLDSLKQELIRVHRPLDLANDTIWLTMNSPVRDRINHLAYEIASPIHVKEVADESVEELVKQVAEGKIKYTVCDEDVAAPYLMRYPNLDGSVAVGFEQHQAWVVNKHATQLLDKLNQFLEDFIGSAAYWQIYKKYY